MFGTRRAASPHAASHGVDGSMVRVGARRASPRNRPAASVDTTAATASERVASIAHTLSSTPSRLPASESVEEDAPPHGSARHEGHPRATASLASRLFVSTPAATGTPASPAPAATAP
jgi:hypothetical protein